jgi:hypothetical protein
MHLSGATTAGAPPAALSLSPEGSSATATRVGRSSSITPLCDTGAGNSESMSGHHDAHTLLAIAATPSPYGLRLRDDGQQRPPAF